MIHLYTILYTIALVLVLPFEYLKRPKEMRKQWLNEKLGFTGEYQKGPRPVIWIHAVSVGETLAALPLIRKLRESGYPSVILSTITDTGRQIALEKIPEGAKTLYLPFDLKMFLRRAIRSLSPDLFVTMETELWPNLLGSMKDAAIPVFIFNGRISDRSFPRYKKIRFFLSGLLEAVETAGMQTGQDAARIGEMGMDTRKIHITGNFKFDIQGTLAPPGWVSLLKGTTIVAGSTHELEEEIVLEAYLKLKENRSPLNLVLAPRHPKRFPEVEALLKSRGLAYLKRSELCRSQGELQDVVVLVDVLGELAGIYSAAHVCIIGGSFVPVGGHNLFEAAYWSKAIICGPHMNNFPLVREFMDRNAVLIAKDGSLYDILSDVLDNPRKRELIGENAQKVFRDNSGAVTKAFDILRPYLERIRN
jgi:3-deoxy-D-manno-octulosonic-acid transferase